MVAAQQLQVGLKTNRLRERDGTTVDGNGEQDRWGKATQNILPVTREH